MNAKDTIKNYLDQRAQSDAMFAQTYKKKNKTLDECFRYITEQARSLAKNNCACVDDATVYGWAVHYYDEDTIKVDNDEPMVASSDQKVASKKKKVATSSKTNTSPASEQLTLFEL